MRLFKQSRVYWLGLIVLSIVGAIISSIKTLYGSFFVEVIFSFLIIIISSLILGGVLWLIQGWFRKEFHSIMFIKILIAVSFILDLVYALDLLK